MTGLTFKIPFRGCGRIQHSFDNLLREDFPLLSALLEIWHKEEEPKAQLGGNGQTILDLPGFGFERISPSSEFGGQLLWAL